MNPTRIVSADDHVDLRWMPSDAFNIRVPEHLRDSAPNVHEKDGKKVCGATFASDEVGLRLLDFIGEDNVMFASDYPHGDRSFPNSRSMVDKNLGHLTEELQQKLLCDNATRIFKIPSAA